MNRNVCILACLAASSLALHSCIAAATTAVAAATGSTAIPSLNPVKAVSNLLNSGAPEQLDDCTIQLQGSQITTGGAENPTTEAFAFTDNHFLQQAGTIANQCDYNRSASKQATLTKRSTQSGTLLTTSTYSLTFTDSSAGTYSVETRNADGQLLSTGKGNFRLL